MEWKKHIDTSILYLDNGYVSSATWETQDQLANIRRNQFGQRTYRSLSPIAEQPGPDTIVAIDTEFVALKQPEIEMNSEGEMETIRPMTHALARVSVVRSQGLDEGLPFIDDYVIIKEHVVDYLTLYSGITRGDLDPRTSVHTLVPLKQAFKKLWVLLNLGCKFLGHGLKQDFRVINIQVPKAQIIDTIDLFFLKTRLRKLSLAFLAWCVLKENIQLETHDSIEDARTALKLYRKFLEYDDAGILELQLQEIYREGRETNFKPPKRDDSELRRGTGTPPVGAPAPGSATSPLLARNHPAPPSIKAAASAAVEVVAAVAADTKLPKTPTTQRIPTFATSPASPRASTVPNANTSPSNGIAKIPRHNYANSYGSGAGSRHISGQTLHTSPFGGGSSHTANGGSSRYHPPTPGYRQQSGQHHVNSGHENSNHSGQGGHGGHSGHSLPYRQYRRS